MKCDQALDALETGGFLRRWQANRHANRCPKCSEQAKALHQIVEALSEVPPLTESERRSWMKVADADDFLPIRPRIWTAQRVALATFFGLATVGYWLSSLPDNLVTTPIVVAIDPVVIKRATLRNLDTLHDKTSSLSHDLDDLLREVDLLDARRDVEALQLEFASLDG